MTTAKKQAPQNLLEKPSTNNKALRFFREGLFAFLTFIGPCSNFGLSNPQGVRYEYFAFGRHNRFFLRFMAGRRAPFWNAVGADDIPREHHYGHRDWCGSHEVAPTTKRHTDWNDDTSRERSWCYEQHRTSRLRKDHHLPRINASNGHHDVSGAGNGAGSGSSSRRAKTQPASSRRDYLGGIRNLHHRLLRNTEGGPASAANHSTHCSGPVAFYVGLLFLTMTNLSS